jgi:glyoxylase-like metal-dependent hydrolase (beta-lactamase superfamily II)
MDKKLNGGNPEDNDDSSARAEPVWVSVAGVFQRSNPVFDNILFLPGDEHSANTYILVGEYLTIVDPALDYRVYSKLFSQPQYGPGDVRAIVLTRSAPNHALGAMELFRYSAVKRCKNLEFVLHKSGAPALKKIVKQFGCSVTEVRGDETLRLSGQDWEVIHTAEPSADCICLYNAATRTLISGDTLRRDGTVAHADRGSKGAAHSLHSLRSLMRCNTANLLPGHGLPDASFDQQTIEDRYLTVMRKVAGVKAEAPSLEVALALAQRGFFHEALFYCDKELTQHPRDRVLVKLKAFCLSSPGRLVEQPRVPGKTGEMRIEPTQLEFLERLKSDFVLKPPSPTPRANSR